MNESDRDGLERLIEGHFYWVHEETEGWTPAQFSEKKESCNCWEAGYYFWPIGMDYEYRLGTHFDRVCEEIVMGEEKR